jgi:hypothetical protein
MILALCTLGPETQLWLLPAHAGDGSPFIAHEVWQSERGLADGLLSHIQALLVAQSSDWPSLTAIIIKSGPGSFTSLRIGHTVANTLASSLNLPLAGAVGDDWMRLALTALESRPAGEPVWPEYGAEANITKPRT